MKKSFFRSLIFTLYICDLWVCLDFYYSYFTKCFVRIADIWVTCITPAGGCVDFLENLSSHSSISFLSIFFFYTLNLFEYSSSGARKVLSEWLCTNFFVENRNLLHWCLFSHNSVQSMSVPFAPNCSLYYQTFSWCFPSTLTSSQKVFDDTVVLLKATSIPLITLSSLLSIRHK